MNRVLAAVAALALTVTTALVVVLSLEGTALADTATFSKDSDWGSGYQAKYTITNTSSTTEGSWKVEFDLPSGTTLGSYWDALLTQSGGHYTFTNRDYNGSLAPGASVSFGFIVNGPGQPQNCLLDGGSCAGGPPTSPPPTSPTPPPPPPPGSTLPVAPYVDMGSWPTPTLTDMSSASGLKDFTLAFITASNCKAMWFNAYDPRQAWAKDQIDAIRAAGGDVKISFGGANGVEVEQACPDAASTFAEYDAVVKAYALNYIDFDIEGSAVAEPATTARRAAALKMLQDAHPNLRISLTLPVLPEGLTSDGLGVVQAVRDAGVNIDVVNVMAMDYYRSVDYGDAALQAAQSTFNQLKTLYPGKTDAQVWRMVGVTPMLGQNDDGHVYDQTAARKLVAFAGTHHLGELAFWEETRDRNACTGALYKCTNVPQSPYEFSKIFAGYQG